MIGLTRTVKKMQYKEEIEYTYRLWKKIIFVVLVILICTIVCFGCYSIGQRIPIVVLIFYILNEIFVFSVVLIFCVVGHILNSKFFNTYPPICIDKMSITFPFRKLGKIRKYKFSDILYAKIGRERQTIMMSDYIELDTPDGKYKLISSMMKTEEYLKLKTVLKENNILFIDGIKK